MVETPFAFAVRRLARGDLPVTQIAAMLRRTEAEVMEALRMLGLSLPGEHSLSPAKPRDAAVMDQIPKKWQDHYGSK